MRIQEHSTGFPTHPLALALTLTALLTHTTALPSPLSSTPHRTLLTRDNQPAENVTEFLTDPTHPGTLHCFTTGTYLPKSLLIAPINRICTPDAENPGTTSFTYAPFLDAALQPSYPHQTLELNMDIPMMGRQFAVVDMQLAMGSKHASVEECVWALDFIRRMCRDWYPNPGKGSTQGAPVIPDRGDIYTQGGWWQYQDDGTTFGLDPAFRNEDGSLGDEDGCC